MHSPPPEMQFGDARAKVWRIFGECKKKIYKFPIIAVISDESNISNAKHFLPKSLSDAPMW